jgi:hypothetical protein
MQLGKSVLMGLCDASTHICLVRALCVFRLVRNDTQCDEPFMLLLSQYRLLHDVKGLFMLLL